MEYQFDTRVDERKCRGCKACIKICPTRVFDKKEKNIFGKKKEIAYIYNTDDCFGCLSCTQVCPSSAVTINLKNGGREDKDYIVPNFYRNAKFLENMDKYIGWKKEEVPLPQDHEEGMKEVAFLLINLMETIKDQFSYSTRALGFSAGRETAKKMPIIFQPGNIPDVMDRLQDYLNGGFHFTFRQEDEDVNLHFTTCALREVCELGNIPLGSDLCNYFHTYLNGIIYEYTQKKFSMKIVEAGDKQCKVELKKRLL